MNKTHILIQGSKVGIYTFFVLIGALIFASGANAQEITVTAELPGIVGLTENNKKIVLTPKNVTEVTRKEEREAKNNDKKALVDGLTAKERANKIDNYYRQWDLPLVGYGDEFVKHADAQGMDWRLAPALAMRETTAGKNMCETERGAHNVFGWGGCEMRFDSIEHAIERVNINLAGNNPKTAHYYGGKDLQAKLRTYNSVIPNYPQEVMNIMKKISEQPSEVTSDILVKR